MTFGSKTSVLGFMMCVLAVGLAGCFDHAQFGPGIEAHELAEPPVVPSQCAGAQPGAIAWRDMALRKYPSTRDLGIVRACAGSDRSLHKAGRAFDWGLNINNSAEKQLANGFIGWALSPDEFGHSHAMARRMGIAELIWNRRIYTTRQSPLFTGVYYSGASAHTDHIHMSFTKRGGSGWVTWWWPSASCDQPSEAPYRWNGSNCVR
ncbi:MAG: hypothetical protein R3A47_08465 [Polyangiales bacterium]